MMLGGVKAVEAKRVVELEKLQAVLVVLRDPAGVADVEMVHRTQQHSIGLLGRRRPAPDQRGETTRPTCLQLHDNLGFLGSQAVATIRLSPPIAKGDRSRSA